MKAKTLRTQAEIFDSLTFWYLTASEDQHARGLCWYAEAHTIAQDLANATRYSVEQCACVLSAFSPRLTWARAVEYACFYALNSSLPIGTRCLARSLIVARCALAEGLNCFGPRANKTREFAKAIMGDPNAVVLDVWMLRSIGWVSDTLTSGQYAFISEALRARAEAFGLTPRELQAIVWVTARESLPRRRRQ